MHPQSHQLPTVYACHSKFQILHCTVHTENCTRIFCASDSLSPSDPIRSNQYNHLINNHLPSRRAASASHSNTRCERPASAKCLRFLRTCCAHSAMHSVALSAEVAHTSAVFGIGIGFRAAREPLDVPFESIALSYKSTHLSTRRIAQHKSSPARE